MDEFASLDNELMSAEQADLPVEEETYNGNREYDPGPNDGKYGYIEVEQDGVMMQCTNAYTSKAYGGQYCVGDTYTTPNGGTQPIRAIGVHGIETAPATWDAEETYADVGEKLGMSMEEWTEFSAEIQQLNETVDGLKGNMFGPTEQERGRLGIRISQENPDWTEAEVMAEADRILEEKWMTSDAYREAALAETALFEKYGITKPNPAVYGTGIWQDEDGKYFRFESNQGHLWQTSQDDSFLDYAVPIGIGLGIGVITGGLGSALGTGALGTVGGGALNGVISSAIGQVATTGSLDPSSLLTSAILGGIGGLADLAVDGGLPSGLDESVWEIADTLGMEYAEVVDLIEGVATGAVRGDDLESIVLGAVGDFSGAQIKDWLQGELGDSFNVDDLFKDGQSTIPTEALYPLVDLALNTAIEGGASAEDVVKMAYEYFQAGGDVDFLLPGMPDGSFVDWMDINFPDIAIDIDLPNINLPDLGIDLPNIDLPDLPDLPDFNIGDPCSDEAGNEGFLNELGVCDIEVDLPDLPDLPDFNIGDPCSDEAGNEGFLNEMGVCDIEVDLPDLPDLPDFNIGDPCSDEAGNEGFLNASGLCDVELPDLPDFNIGDPCSDEAGNEGFLNASGLCDVELPEFEEPDWELPEWDTPEWDFPDIELPDLPDAPEVTAQATTTKPFKTSRTEQFAYSPFNVYKPVAREDLSGINLPSPGKGLFK